MTLAHGLPNSNQGLADDCRRGGYEYPGGPVAVDEIPHEESGDPSGDPPGGYTQPNWLRLIPMASPWESRTVRN
ncbi:MAG: hypothetical protein VYC69_00020 [Chloroflexota bacterium]|nr:hypothetical protein [Chloroflexota bacterium]